MKKLLFFLLVSACIQSNAQYIGVRARYTDTRLVDDAPNPPKRENRLVLSFFYVAFNGTENVWPPATLSGYDIWVYKMGLQYGNVMGGVLDSTGNNYPGYSFPAPRAVGYYNSLGQNYIDCDPNAATHYIVNGHELDCGFITVSYWDVDWGTMIPYEAFPAPNICLPYYWFDSPYYFNPGNVNFEGALGGGPPYNLYNFFCGTGVLNLVMRGLLSYDSISTVVLPVRFANVRAELQNGAAGIEWSNMTESDVDYYTVEKSSSGINWQEAGRTIPVRNDGSQADYNFQTPQVEDLCYYRVKAVELSGAFFYSHIMVLRKAPGSPLTGEINRELRIYPNPVVGDIFSFCLTNAPKGRYISTIITPDGKRIKQKLISHDSNGDLIRQIETIGLLPGIYRLVVQSDSYRYTQTFMYGY